MHEVKYCFTPQSSKKKIPSLMHERWKESEAELEKVGQRKDLMLEISLHFIMVSDDLISSHWVKGHSTILLKIHQNYGMEKSTYFIFISENNNWAVKRGHVKIK